MSSPARHPGMAGQLAIMFGALRASPLARPLAWLVAAIVAVVLLTAYGQIRLNSWNKPFFDALSRRDLNEFLVQLGVFVVIAGVLLTLNVVQRWLVETLKMRLREGLVQDLVGLWMLPRRAFWLTQAGPIGVNPDQRMAEDAQKLCDMTADLGVGLFQAGMLVASFAGILWTISADFSVHVDGVDYAVPGFMLWAAILYAGTGSLLSYLVGRPLVSRNAERYAREAELRFALVRVNEHLDGISLAGGEADEKRRVLRHLKDVLGATRSIIRGLTNLTWVTAGFGWTTTVAPILVAAPLYLTGKISFGGLMMAAAAFTQAQGSLRWFVDNFSVLADWRATLLRVAGFREALSADPELREFDQRIEYAQGPAGTLRIEGLEVVSPAGRDRLDEASLSLSAGERVLVAAAPGTGRTVLFRALAGLWPWGRGRIERPAGETLLYMPRGTPYLPSGSLREVLAYPHKVDRHAPEAYGHALGRLGLAHLAPKLDVEQRWDRELGHDEQIALAFARMLLQAPQWVVIDEAFSALDEEMMARVLDLFTRELAGTGIVHLGKAGAAREALFTRTVNLVRADAAPVTS